MMGIVSKSSDCTSLQMAEERGLMLEAFRVVGEGNEKEARAYSVLSFIMALFGMDFGGVWGKICKECVGGGEGKATPQLIENKTPVDTPTR